MPDHSLSKSRRTTGRAFLPVPLFTFNTRAVFWKWYKSISGETATPPYTAVRKLRAARVILPFHGIGKTRYISRKSRQLSVAFEIFWGKSRCRRECSHLLLSLHNEPVRRCSLRRVRITRWRPPPTVCGFSWWFLWSRLRQPFCTLIITGLVSARHATIRDYNSSSQNFFTVILPPPALFSSVLRILFLIRGCCNRKDDAFLDKYRVTDLWDNWFVQCQCTRLCGSSVVSRCLWHEAGQLWDDPSDGASFLETRTFQIFLRNNLCEIDASFSKICAPSTLSKCQGYSIWLI